MLYINEATDKAIELTIEEVGKDSPAGGMIKTLYGEVKRLKNSEKKSKVTEEMTKFWLTDYKLEEEAVQSLTEIANGDYSPTTLFNDIFQTWEENH